MDGFGLRQRIAIRRTPIQKFGRAPQSITNFSSRNADEIRRARQVQSDEYQGLSYAEKWERLAFREQLLLDIEERLKDPGLSDAATRREDLRHGTNAAYVVGCVC
jgi:hypothetical protein